MRIAYFGTSDFAVPALKAVAEHVILVVSQPDRPKGRGLQLQPSPVKAAALELGLPVETPEKARDPEFIERLAGLHLDFLLVAAYGQILSTKLLGAAKHGGINLHGSILPEYRGAAPIQRALLDGRTETGVTLMQMDRGMDSGDMIAIERLPILPGETAGALQSRLAELAANMAHDWAPRLAAGDYPRTPQNHDAATYAPKVEREETRLQWTESAEVSFRRFQAFTPNPGTSIATRLGEARLSEIALRPDLDAAPGTVLALQPELTVAMASGALALIELQPAGKKRMRGRDWANGLRLQVGDSLLPE